jgi:hypothetical protein
VISTTEEPRKTPLAVLSRVALIAILVWLGLLVLLALSQRSMIYYPSRNDAASLEREASVQGFEPWNNPQGGTIGYRILPAPEDPRPPLAILITHGNAGYAMHRADYAAILRAAAPDRALSVYILEYPGYGSRSGTPSQTAFLAAADEAVALIPDNKPLILLIAQKSVSPSRALSPILLLLPLVAGGMTMNRILLPPLRDGKPLARKRRRKSRNWLLHQTIKLSKKQRRSK